MRTILQFVKNHGPYTPGDVAGFPDAAARELLAGGVAELSTPEPAAQPDTATPAVADVEGAAPITTTQAARRGRPPKS